ncbi:MAG: SpoIID/LytB domain-containing protein [Reinekea sp.]
MLLSHLALAADATIRVQILSKYHPQQLDITTRSRVFHLTPQTHLHWQFSAPLGEDITVTVNNELQRVYRGNLTVDWDGDEYRIENKTPLEVYVAGVVVGELGADSEVELIKAQAVLARTYALKVGAREPLSDLAYHQVFAGFDVYARRRYAITLQTRGEVLLRAGELAAALFHAECGSAIYFAGQFWPTADKRRALPLPVGVSVGAPWQVMLTDAQLAEVFPDVEQLVLLARQPVVVDIGARQIGLESFRLQVNRRFGWNRLPSNEFSVERLRDGWLLRGRGRGHLVGMCQRQAGELARNGIGYRGILALFYPESEVSGVSDLNP